MFRVMNVNEVEPNRYASALCSLS